ncbi:hypothetical protein ATC03_11945 [Agromyces aureus]|uniref:4,4'-diaponeurosporenoate glycosyltransferase n=1 Tax=Agromyces aureus TaxID=453304 RepID=A0A191WL08_9MICO|nr:hypothetical protein ATC03_11945 [Agromyces aureus]
MRAIAVVVPVHDEAELLGRCLASIGRAAADASLADVHIRAFVVLDACGDGSAAIASMHDVSVVEVDRRNVGAARAAGVTAALDAFAAYSSGCVWLAHTDGDSEVPANWLSHQRDLADGGADLVVGTVRPDFRDLSRAQVTAWLATHHEGSPNGHVHGANFGIRASAHFAAGGFAEVTVHEDVRLVDRARQTWARIVASDAAEVRTSGRPVGRTPDGYARYLREDLVRRAGSALVDGAEDRDVGIPA